MRSNRWFLLVFLLIFAACGKQGVGELCQANADCESNSCTESTGKCSATGAAPQGLQQAPEDDAPAADSVEESD